MTLSFPRNRMLPWLALSGVGLSLFFGDSIGDLELPFDGVGTLLLVVGTWYSVDALHRKPAGEEEAAIAPVEWQAWVSVAFVGAILASMLTGAEAFASDLPIGQNPEAAEAGRRVGGLFVAWLVLSHILRERWSGRVQADERDTQIDLRAGQWGRGGTALVVLGVAVLLGFQDTDQLRRLSYPLLAHLLMLSLLGGLWLEQFVAGILYWRDRRAAA